MTDEVKDRRDRKSVLERHFGSVMSLLILAAILWVANNAYMQGIKQAELVGLFNTLDLRIVHLKELIGSVGSDRYTGQDADDDKDKLIIRLAAEKERVNVKFDDVYRRFDQCNERINHIEIILNEAH